MDDVASMRTIKARLDATAGDTPNLVDVQAREAFRSFAPPSVADRLPGVAITPAQRQRRSLIDGRRPQDRHAARAQHVLGDAAVPELLREPRRPAGEHRLLGRDVDEACTRRAPSAGAIDPCYPEQARHPARAQPAVREARSGSRWTSCSSRWSTTSRRRSRTRWAAASARRSPRPPKPRAPRSRRRKTSVRRRREFASSTPS